MAIRVKVKHFLLIGTGPTKMREDILKLSEGNMTTLIEALKRRYGKRIEEYLIGSQSKELQRGILILINGINVLSMGGLSAQLHDGDEVMIFPAVAGG